MATSIYDDKMVMPDDSMLSIDLGESKIYLDRICEFIEAEYGQMKPEWKYYNKKSGWLLKLFHKKRNVLFIVPCEKRFRAAFSFGEKAFEAILNGDFPEAIKKDLLEARKYAEGRGLQLEVRSEKDLEYILSLIRVKMAN